MKNFPWEKPRLSSATDSAALIYHVEPSEWSSTSSRSSSPSFHIDKTLSYGGVCCLVKIFQLTILALLIYVLVASVQSVISSKSAPDGEENTDLIAHSGQLGVPHLPKINRNSLPEPPSHRLLDIDNFKILRDADSALYNTELLLFLAVIHSKPDHFRHRELIRSTWGSLKQLENKGNRPWGIRLVFVLGEVSPEHFRVSELVKGEADEHGDIVIGSFPDSYRNLRYKHIFGLRWAIKHCPSVSFIIKADDDAFIDVLGLKAFLERILGPLENKYKDILAGNVSPEGMLPLRSGKWAVSHQEYPWSHYPQFLGGLAYLMTPDVALDLYKAAHVHTIPKIWVDDVWVTGILRSSLRIHPLFLNARYGYDHEEISRWLSLANNKSPPPSNIVHLDSGRSDWWETAHGLWKHVLLSYNITSPIENRLHQRKTNLKIDGLR